MRFRKNFEDLTVELQAAKTTKKEAEKIRDKLVALGSQLEPKYDGLVRSLLNEHNTTREEKDNRKEDYKQISTVLEQGIRMLKRSKDGMESDYRPRGEERNVSRAGIS